MQIYFAHPIPTYDSKQESEVLKVIRQKFPDAIIYNPADFPSQRMSFYFRRVCEADLVVFMAKVEGIIGRGVFDEVRLAKMLETPVLYYDLQTRQFYSEFVIERLSGESWADYARVEEGSV